MRGAAVLSQTCVRGTVRLAKKEEYGGNIIGWPVLGDVGGSGVCGNEARPFAGYNFLIIEDEMIQAWRIGDMLAMLGGTVGKIAFNYDQGREALADVSWDCAIVDINLNGKPVFPLVAILEQARIPFVYCSAYADILVEVFPEAASTACVSKPVTIDKLRDAVLLVLKPRKL